MKQEIVFALEKGSHLVATKDYGYLTSKIQNAGHQFGIVKDGKLYLNPGEFEKIQEILKTEAIQDAKIAEEEAKKPKDPKETPKVIGDKFTSPNIVYSESTSSWTTTDIKPVETIPKPSQDSNSIAAINDPIDTKMEIVPDDLTKMEEYKGYVVPVVINSANETENIFSYKNILSKLPKVFTTGFTKLILGVSLAYQFESKMRSNYSIHCVVFKVTIWIHKKEVEFYIANSNNCANWPEGIWLYDFGSLQNLPSRVKAVIKENGQLFKLSYEYKGSLIGDLQDDHLIGKDADGKDFKGVHKTREWITLHPYWFDKTKYSMRPEMVFEQLNHELRHKGPWFIGSEPVKVNGEFLYIGQFHIGITTMWSNENPEPCAL